MFGRKKLLHEIKDLQERLAETIRVTLLDEEILRKQMREVAHNIGLEKLRHELELEEARASGRRAGDESVREAEKLHAKDVIARLESLNTLVIKHLPMVNVDKKISRKDKETTSHD